jgi:xylose isomerase
LKNTDYLKLRKERYSSFDSGAGSDYVNNKLTLDDLRNYAIKNGEPKQISGKQELYESIIQNAI